MFILLISYAVFISLVYYYNQDDIIMSAYDSKLFGAKHNNNFLMYLTCLLCPWKLYSILKTKNFTLEKLAMKFKLRYLVAALAVFITLYVVSQSASYYNQSAKIKIAFNNKMNERLIIIDNITRSVTQKFQISKINDSSFYKNLIAITQNRMDGQNLIFKMVMENNPNANYGEVSSIYREVMSTIENERNRLIVVENELSNIDKQYSELHTLFPSNIYLYYEPKTLNYKVISTMENKITNKTGIDSNVYLK